MIEFDGIVIRSTPFRDNDAMVNVVANDRFHSFLAKGVLKFESKNSSSVNLYSKSHFQLSKGKEGYLLRSSELLDSFQNIKNSLSALAVLDFIGEVTNKLVISDDASNVYPFLEKSLTLLNAGFDPYSVALIYLAHILNQTGYGLDVDSCVICGQTSQIVAVSYKDGGFICQNCFDPLNHVKCNARKLKIIRYIFKVDLNNFGQVSFEKDECLNILEELGKFVFDIIQIDLKSLKLIKKL